MDFMDFSKLKTIKHRNTRMKLFVCVDDYCCPGHQVKQQKVDHTVMINPLAMKWNMTSNWFRRKPKIDFKSSD